MRIAFFISLLIIVSSCSSRLSKSGSGVDNVPLADTDGNLKDVNFAFDSFLLDKTAKTVLENNANWLHANSSVSIQIEGHCDERGTGEYNMVLGANRARVAADYLRQLGVQGSRISTVSYGEELPLDARSIEEAWARNRRAHFGIRE